MESPSFRLVIQTRRGGLKGRRMTMFLSLGEDGEIGDLAFCPTLKALYETGVSTGRSGTVYPRSGGLSTLNNLLSIRRLFEAARPKRTLEIGFGCGGSALMFAACHHALGRKAQAQHTAIDPFQESHSDSMGSVNLERAGLDGYVRAILEPSQRALHELLRRNERFGIIYLDGSKQPDDVDCDAALAKRLLTVGGVLIFDDSTMPSVFAVIRRIEKAERETFRRLPRSDYRRVSPFDALAVRAAEALGKVQMVAFRKVAEP